MNSSDNTSAQTPAAAYPSLAANEEVSLQEVSHVFYCMQCDLQFQVDMAITGQNESHERAAGIVRVRLDPCGQMDTRLHSCAGRPRLGSCADIDHYAFSRADRQDGSRVVSSAMMLRLRVEHENRVLHALPYFFRRFPQESESEKAKKDGHTDPTPTRRAQRTAPIYRTVANGSRLNRRSTDRVTPAGYRCGLRVSDAPPSPPRPGGRTSPVSRGGRVDGGTRGDGHDEPRPCRDRPARQRTGVTSVAPGE
jgi:hypothetical protein